MNTRTHMDLQGFLLLQTVVYQAHSLCKFPFFNLLSNRDSEDLVFSSLLLFIITTGSL